MFELQRRQGRATEPTGWNPPDPTGWNPLNATAAAYDLGYTPAQMEEGGTPGVMAASASSAGGIMSAEDLQFGDQGGSAAAGGLGSSVGPAAPAAEDWDWGAAAETDAQMSGTIFHRVVEEEEAEVYQKPPEGVIEEPNEHNLWRGLTDAQVRTHLANEAALRGARMDELTLDSEFERMNRAPLKALDNRPAAKKKP